MLTSFRDGVFFPVLTTFLSYFQVVRACYLPIFCISTLSLLTMTPRSPRRERPANNVCPMDLTVLPSCRLPFSLLSRVLFGLSVLPGFDSRLLRTTGGADSTVLYPPLHRRILLNGGGVRSFFPYLLVCVIP